jgi:hypothetical protein
MIYSNPNNFGQVNGVLHRITDYLKNNGGKGQRLDILVPSMSPIEDVGKVSVHTTEFRNPAQVGLEIKIHYTVTTYLEKGTGKGEGRLFDKSRLDEFKPA